MNFKKGKASGIIRYIYLYMVTAITIVLILISTIGLINLVLKELVFDVKGWNEIDYMTDEGIWECQDNALFEEWNDEAGDMTEKDPGMSEEEKDAEREECYAKERASAELHSNNDMKRDLVNWLSMLIVSFPLYLYHWSIIKRDSKK